MPRVHTVTAASSSKQRTCTACRNPIEPGQRVYKWTRRNMPTQWRHHSCGPPRSSELSGRKTAVVDDAVRDAESALADVEQITDASEVQNIIENVAAAADEVAQEYYDGVDNMPENLQHGAQAEAMHDVAERLHEWADNIRQFDPDDYEESDDLEDAIDAARELITDMPEYEG